MALAVLAAWALVPGPACALSDAASADVARAVELRVAKKFDEASTILRGLAERSAADPEARSEALYQQGLVMQESGRMDEALALYDSVVREYPGQPSAPYAQLEWSLAKARMGSKEQAMAGLALLMTRFPRFGAVGLMATGDLLEQAGQDGEASMIFRRVITTFPASPEAKSARVRLAAVCGRITGSPVASATAYAEIMARGECLMDATNYTGAEDLFNSALRNSPPVEWKVELFLALGRGAVAQEKYGLAEKYFRKAAKTATDPAMAARARMSIVQGHLDRSKLKDAVRELEGIVMDYPGTAQAVQAQLMVGSCYEAMRDRKKAIEAYRRVMTWAPQTAAAADAQQGLMRVLEVGQ